MARKGSIVKDRAAKVAQAPVALELPKPEPIRVSADIKIENPIPAEPFTMAPATTAGVKLDLGCGQSPREGFEGVDLFSKDAKHKVDLFKFPWPFKDNSVDELHCSHFIEHIPMAMTPQGQDLFFAFFDECYRILKPDATMTVICPSCRSERAFQDPTHRRFIAQATFFYLSKDWRKMNKLDHYNVKCDFSGNVNFSFPIEYQSRHDEVRNEIFSHAWNVILDWTAVLKAIK